LLGCRLRVASGRLRAATTPARRLQAGRPTYSRADHVVVDVALRQARIATQPVGSFPRRPRYLNDPRRARTVASAAPRGPAARAVNHASSHRPQPRRPKKRRREFKPSRQAAAAATCAATDTRATRSAAAAHRRGLDVHVRCYPLELKLPRHAGSLRPHGGLPAPRPVSRPAPASSDPSRTHRPRSSPRPPLTSRADRGSSPRGYAEPPRSAVGGHIAEPTSSPTRDFYRPPLRASSSGPAWRASPKRDSTPPTVEQVRPGPTNPRRELGSRGRR